MTAVTRGMERMACSTRPTAALSSTDSARWAAAEEATKVTVEVVRGLNGWANRSALTLAEVDGRNCELLDFSTLDRVGRHTISRIVTAIQPAMIGQRKRTVNRPRAANKRWSSRDRGRDPWGRAHRRERSGRLALPGQEHRGRSVSGSCLAPLAPD